MATVQSIQNIFSNTFFVTATDTEQLYSLETDKSSSLYCFFMLLTEQVLKLSATNIAENFDSRDYILIKDIFTNFNISNYICNRFLSVGIQFYKNLFNSFQYYNRQNLQFSENLFNSAEYYNKKYIFLNILSQQQLLENTDFSISSKISNFDIQFSENLFYSVEFYNKKYISLNILSQQQLLENTNFNISSKISNFDIQSSENLFYSIEFYNKKYLFLNILF